MNVPWSIRIASLLCWLLAFGLGIFCIPAIRNVRAGRDVPMVFGYPAYGHGPFEKAGIPTTVPLLAGFLIICILEGVAGWLLWNGRVAGAILSLVLVPLGAIYWWGFALPIPPFVAAVAVALTVAGWDSLG